MYEIWLALNIVFEIARANAVPVVFAALVLLALTLNALRKRGGAWRRALVPALAVGLLVALAAALALPALTRASLSDLSYRVDWLILLAIAAAFGGIAAAFAWPLAVLLRGARGTTVS